VAGRSITNLLTPQNKSFLGSTSSYGTPTAATTAELLIIEFIFTILWALIGTLLCVMALVLTASLIENKQIGRPFDVASILRPLRTRARRIRFVSVAMVSIFILTVAVQTIVTKFWSTRPDFQQTPYWHFQVFDGAMILGMCAAIVLVIAPWALDLTHDAEAEPTLDSQYQQARALVVIAPVAWLALEYGWSRLADHLAQHQGGLQNFAVQGDEPIFIMLLAVVLTWLFTSFSVITHPESKEETPSAPLAE